MKLTHVSSLFSHVDVIVHVDQTQLTLQPPPASDIPSNIGPYTGNSQWYIAAQFTYDDYRTKAANNNFELGTDSETQDDSGVTYTNERLKGSRKYSVYIRVSGTDDSGVGAINANTSLSPSLYVLQMFLSTTSDGVGALTAGTSSTDDLRLLRVCVGALCSVLD